MGYALNPLPAHDYLDKQEKIFTNLHDSANKKRKPAGMLFGKKKKL